ncbi:hypothetical protein ACOME3_010351 [Neoechinorhynchus agilis]
MFGPHSSLCFSQDKTSLACQLAFGCRFRVHRPRFRQLLLCDSGFEIVQQPPGLLSGTFLLWPSLPALRDRLRFRSKSQSR